jgi:hypothetical protein
MLPGQFFEFGLKLFLAFVEKIVASVNDLAFYVVYFFLLHKLQKWLQVLQVEQRYNVVAESAHLGVS